MDLNPFIRDVPDFPKPGIVFKDITPMLKNPQALTSAWDQLSEPYRESGITLVAGIESRGFIFGTGVAERLNAGFIPLRKEGKLPADTHAYTYALEYGEATLEIHKDAAGPGDRILLVDDLLATGGTVEASIHLVEKLGATIVGAAFVVELAFLGGRARLGDVPITSLLTYS